MKHSWSDMFSNTGEILVYLLPLSVTDTISFARVGIGGMEQEIKDWASELNFIEVYNNIYFTIKIYLISRLLILQIMFEVLEF